MKKILAFLLAAMMVCMLAACSGSGENAGGASLNSTEPEATEAPAPAKVADDNECITLKFTPPEGYDEVTRNFEYDADGEIADKSFNYTYADGAEVTIGYTRGRQITDAVPQSYLDDAEKVEYSGKSFSVITQGKTIMAVCQDGDIIYGLGWSFVDELDRDAFDQFANGISFIDDIDTTGNGDDLGDIRYTLDSSLNTVTVINSLTETPDGKTVDKSISWYYGADSDNLDFRLKVQLFKDTTVEEQLPEDYTNTTVELGGVSYTAVYQDETIDTPFAYYTQHGSDVYQIRNMGVSSLWSTKRSDESYEALEKLMKTVSFE